MQFTHKRKMLILAAALAVPALAPADDAKWYDKLTVGGFVDAYYKFNPDGRKGSAASTTDKVFDVHQNNIALTGGKVSVSSPEAVVDLYFGDYADLLTGLSAPAIPPEATVVGQAYITQSFGPLSVTMGRFFTHLGYEVNDSVANLNFTRGLIFANLPFYHQGVKFAYSPMEGLGLMAMVDNGNSINYPGAEETAAGAQISYTGIKGLSLYGNYYYEPVLAGPVWEKKHYFDLVFSYGIMEGLTAAGEYLYWTQIGAGDTDTAGDVISPNFMVDPTTGKKLPYSPKTQGYALYVDYVTPIEGLSVTPRFEALYAPDSMLTKFDYTLTGRYVKGAITNWLEFRLDASDDAVYPGKVGSPEMAYTEMAVTYAVGYKY